VDTDVNDSENSKLRELIAEHLFIGEALRLCWTRGSFSHRIRALTISSGLEASRASR
jgi:hypothetical protein